MFWTALIMGGRGSPEGGFLAAGPGTGVGVGAAAAGGGPEGAGGMAIAGMPMIVAERTTFWASGGGEGGLGGVGGAAGLGGAAAIG